MRYELWRHVAKGSGPSFIQQRSGNLVFHVAYQELQTLKGVDYPFPTTDHLPMSHIRLSELMR